MYNTKMPFSKLIIALLNLPRLILHILFFYLHFKVCNEDVRVSLELRHWNCSSFQGFIYLLVFDKPFRNLFYYRIGNAKYLMWYWLQPHPCFTIAKNSIIAPGFKCVHPYCTIVNAEKVGHNFAVLHNVTIGNRAIGEEKRPIIGDNVVVYCNSIIVGDIKIGNDVTIGAGTFISKNVPDNCLVVGNPAMIIKRNGVSVKELL